jgi:molybdenum cofactor cytidylyltransferase
VVEAALASQTGPVVVVTGHDRAAVEAALIGCHVTFIHNPDFADGLSTSLCRGLEALPVDVDGALVLLGDMPRVTARLADRLVAAFDPSGAIEAVVPVRDGRRGNPVLFGRSLFPELQALTGDVGGRGVLGRYGDRVAEVVVDDDAAFLDVDTPDALIAIRSSGKSTD